MEKRIDDIFDFLDCKKVRRWMLAGCGLAVVYFVGIAIFTRLS